MQNMHIKTGVIPGTVGGKEGWKITIKKPSRVA